MKVILNLVLILVVLVGFNIDTIASMEIKGTVVAKEHLYGHIYDDTAVNPYLLIVRVDEVSKGEIDSKYILVNYYWRLKDSVLDKSLDSTKYSKWTFQLSKQKACNSSIADLQFVMFGGSDKATGMMPRFSRTHGIDSEILPFDEVLPCYKLKRDGFSPVESSTIVETIVPKIDTEYYVLEQERWTNLPNTPLEISLLYGNLILKNNSDKQINEFKLGCVSKNNSEVLDIVKEISEVKYKIKPNEKKLSSVNSIGSDEYMTELKTCYDKNAKLSIIEVQFEDNSVWKIE